MITERDILKKVLALSVKDRHRLNNHFGLIVTAEGIDPPVEDVNAPVEEIAPLSPRPPLVVPFVIINQDTKLNFGTKMQQILEEAESLDEDAYDIAERLDNIVQILESSGQISPEIFAELKNIADEATVIDILNGSVEISYAPNPEKTPSPEEAPPIQPAPSIPGSNVPHEAPPGASPEAPSALLPETPKPIGDNEIINLSGPGEEPSYYKEAYGIFMVPQKEVSPGMFIPVIQNTKLLEKINSSFEKSVLTQQKTGDDAEAKSDAWDVLHNIGNMRGTKMNRNRESPADKEFYDGIENNVAGIQLRMLLKSRGVDVGPNSPTPEVDLSKIEELKDPYKLKYTQSLVREAERNTAIREEIPLFEKTEQGMGRKASQHSLFCHKCRTFFGKDEIDESQLCSFQKPDGTMGQRVADVPSDKRRCLTDPENGLTLCEIERNIRHNEPKKAVPEANTLAYDKTLAVFNPITGEKFKIESESTKSRGGGEKIPLPVSETFLNNVNDNLMLANNAFSKDPSKFDHIYGQQQPGGPSAFDQHMSDVSGFIGDMANFFPGPYGFKNRAIHTLGTSEFNMMEYREWFASGKARTNKPIKEFMTEKGLDTSAGLVNVAENYANMLGSHQRVFSFYHTMAQMDSEGKYADITSLDLGNIKEQQPEVTLPDEERVNNAVNIVAQRRMNTITQYLPNRQYEKTVSRKVVAETLDVISEALMNALVDVKVEKSKENKGNDPLFEDEIQVIRDDIIKSLSTNISGTGENSQLDRGKIGEYEAAIFHFGNDDRFFDILQEIFHDLPMPTHPSLDKDMYPIERPQADKELFHDKLKPSFSKIIDNAQKKVAKSIDTRPDGYYKFICPDKEGLHPNKKIECDVIVDKDTGNREHVCPDCGESYPAKFQAYQAYPHNANVWGALTNSADESVAYRMGLRMYFEPVFEKDNPIKIGERIAGTGLDDPKNMRIWAALNNSRGIELGDDVSFTIKHNNYARQQFGGEGSRNQITTPWAKPPATKEQSKGGRKKEGEEEKTFDNRGVVPVMVDMIAGQSSLEFTLSDGTKVPIIKMINYPELGLFGNQDADSLETKKRQRKKYRSKQDKQASINGWYRQAKKDIKSETYDAVYLFSMFDSVQGAKNAELRKIRKSGVTVLPISEFVPFELFGSVKNVLNYSHDMRTPTEALPVTKEFMSILSEVGLI